MGVEPSTFEQLVAKVNRSAARNHMILSYTHLYIYELIPIKMKEKKTGAGHGPVQPIKGSAPGGGCNLL
jgi:hypothetical protein